MRSAADGGDDLPDRGKLVQPADNIEGGPIWQFDPIPAKPTATRYSLDCDSNATLCELNGITVSESIGHVGYAWRGMGQPIASCAGNGGTGLYVFQDVFNTGAANPTFVSCGFERRAGIAYDLLGPGSGLGNNFFLQPGVDPRTHLPVAFVRQTVVTEGMTDAKFNLHQTVAWGTVRRIARQHRRPSRRLSRRRQSCPRAPRDHFARWRAT